MKCNLMPLVACAALLFAAAPRDGNAEWSAEQRGALGVLQQYVDAEKAGDLARLPPLFHDEFTAWNLMDPAPQAKSAFLQSLAEFLKAAKVAEFEITPVAITITQGIAVVNVTYTFALASSGGAPGRATGPWNSVLVRKDSTWVFLSCTWSDTK